MKLNLRWRPGDSGPLLFVVHGYAEHPSAALQLGAILDPTMQRRLCAPEGGIDIGRDRRTFYNVDFKAKRLEPETFAPALAALDDALDEACREAATSREEAVLAGFSQGAGLSLALALGRSDRPPPAGVLMFSGMLYSREFVDWDLENRSTEVFWGHGAGDDRFTIDDHRVAVAKLRKAGRSVTAMEFDVGHVLSPEGLAAGRDWLVR